MTKAIILAAGTGSRLRPLTNDRPKCMVELLGKPIVMRQLNTLEEAGVSESILVGGYKAEQLEILGKPIVINPEYESSNMVYSLFCAEDQIDNESDWLFSYGDIVFEKSIVEKLLASSAPLSLAIDTEWKKYWQIRMDDPMSDVETLKWTDSRIITELGQVPKKESDIQGQYTGLIYLKKEYVDPWKNAYHQLDQSKLPDGKNKRNLYMTDFLQYLIDTGWEVQGVPIENGWLETDSVEDIENYRKLHDAGRLKQFYDIGQG